MRLLPLNQEPSRFIRIHLRALVDSVAFVVWSIESGFQTKSLHSQ